MKKLNALIIPLLAASLLLGGCSAAAQKSSSPSSESSAPSSQGSSSEKPARTVKIGFVDSGKSFPSDVLGVAEAKGYLSTELKKINATVQLVPFTGAGPAINEALAGKSIDIGDLGDVPALTAKSSGIDTKLIGVLPYVNDAALVVPTGSQITSITQLKGKKVATQKGSYMHRTLIEMLKANGMSVSDIQFINMTGLDAASALLSKSVDAAVLPNTTEAKIILNKNGTSILDCKNHPDWKGSETVVARGEYAKANGDILTAVLKALNEAGAYTKQNPDDAKQILTQSGFSKQVFDFLYPTNDFGYNIDFSDQGITALSNVNQFLVDNKLIKSSVDVKAWADDSYYKQAQQ